MLMKILLSYFAGFLRITIEGYYIERFINMCRNRKIVIWHLKRKKDIELDFRVGINDFKEICKIAKKTKCKLKIKSKNGFPFLLQRYRKRKIFFILLLAIVVLVLLSSHFV